MFSEKQEELLQILDRDTTLPSGSSLLYYNRILSIGTCWIILAMKRKNGNIVEFVLIHRISYSHESL